MLFERLGVHMLRRVRPSKRRCGHGRSQREKQASAQLIASIMFYRLGIEAHMSWEMSLEGRLEDVEVEDLTPLGGKYCKILSMGTGKGVIKADEGQRREGEEREREIGSLDGSGHPRSLHFSVHINPRTSVLLVSSAANDVHVTVSVPAVHYTHSINLVYEIELFISEFQHYFSAIMESFSSAAVGMAKGLVKERSQIAKTWKALHLPGSQS